MSRQAASPAVLAAVQRVVDIVARHRAGPCSELDTITRRALAAFVTRVAQEDPSPDR